MSIEYTSAEMMTVTAAKARADEMSAAVAK